MRELNLVLRFALELGTLAALGYWGFRTEQGPLLRWGLGLGAPLLAAFAWGAFVSPRAAVPLPEVLRGLLALLILGSGAAALALAGRPTTAAAFGVAVAVHLFLYYLWRQYEGGAFE